MWLSSVCWLYVIISDVRYWLLYIGTHLYNPSSSIWTNIRRINIIWFSILDIKHHISFFFFQNVSKQNKTHHEFLLIKKLQVYFVSFSVVVDLSVFSYWYFLLSVVYTSVGFLSMGSYVCLKKSSKFGRNSNNGNNGTP